MKGRFFDNRRAGRKRRRLTPYEKFAEMIDRQHSDNIHSRRLIEIGG
jgi:hypothetical protein